MRYAYLLSVLMALRGLAPAIAADGDVTVTGSFVWSAQKDKTHDIMGVFTPVGENKWSVVWSFKWDKGVQVWKGTAEGNLQDGELKGEALHPNGKRTFTFTTTAKDGQYSGKHTESTGGRSKDIGTIVLKRQ